MKKWFFSLFVATSLFSTVAASQQRIQLEKCLLECYRVDMVAVAKILEKFSPLLENQEYDHVVDTFIEESKKLDIYSETCSTLSMPPPYHSVLFENPYIRISWAVTKSGEQEPPQIHPWKTVMVIIHPAQFYSERQDGVAYEDNWPIGVYLLDPSPELLSCKNIGSVEYNGLVFEIKTVEELLPERGGDSSV